MSFLIQNSVKLIILIDCHYIQIDYKNICQNEMIKSVVNAFIFSVSLQNYELFSQHTKSANPIHLIEEFNQIIILSRKSPFIA